MTVLCASDAYEAEDWVRENLDWVEHQIAQADVVPLIHRALSGCPDVDDEPGVAIRLSATEPIGGFYNDRSGELWLNEDEDRLNKWMVLHELAHWLVDTRDDFYNPDTGEDEPDGDHGPRWQAYLIQFIGAEFGDGIGQQLEVEFEIVGEES